MIKSSTMNEIIDYAEQGIPPGGFIRAVVENDLLEAFMRADKENLNAMFDIVEFMYNNIPADCWGSPEIVDKWIKDNYNA